MIAAERTFIGYSDAHISAYYENARQRRIERQQAARRAFARSDFLTDARLRWWSGEVDRFGHRVDAFGAQVDASLARVDAALSDWRGV